MDRLTQEQSAGYDLKALNGQYCNNYCDEQSAATCRNCAIYQAIQKLAHYEDIEERGKLLILPCNVNDRVHSFYESDIEACFEIGMEVEEILEEMCEERRVTGFYIRNDGLWIVLNGGIFNPDTEIPFEEFGKTVFLTEQEAKEALEGMKE